MIVPRKCVCDICGQEIKYSNIFTNHGREKRHYCVLVTQFENEDIDLCAKPQKLKKDICESCFSKIAQWIAEEAHKEKR